jgi:hypothetical protein
MFTELLSQLRKTFKGEPLRDRMQETLEFYNGKRIEVYQPYIITVKSREILEYINSKSVSTSESNDECLFIEKIKFLKEFNEMLVDIAKKCYLRFSPTMIYTFNNEIHLVFYNTSDNKNVFNGNIHKTLTTITSYVTKLFTKMLKVDFEFTCSAKYISFLTDHEVLNYLIWRQNDCKRNNITTMYKYFETDLQDKSLEEIDYKLSRCISKLKNKNSIDTSNIIQILYGNIIKKHLVYLELTKVNRKCIQSTSFNLQENFKENLVKYVYTELIE